MPSTKITINNNGNIRVEGDFEIVDPQGTPFGLAGRTVIGLCRCGHSKTSRLRWFPQLSRFTDPVVARDLPAGKTENLANSAVRNG